jgi:hypothetical protein
MKHRATNKHFFNRLALGLAIASLCGVTHAKSLSEASTLLEAMGDPNDSELLKSAGLKMGGWINAGVTYNGTSPEDNFNGPVTFGDRSGEFQLDQLNFYLQRAVATEGDSWDFGGRFDVMYGTDAFYTQAYGIPGAELGSGAPLDRGTWDLDIVRSRFYNMAIPQAYLESYVPIGNGLNVKVGHFYTPIGYETVPAPDNFFYSHAYTMQFGEPFTHTGILGNYALNSNWSLMGGAITGSATGGWDGSWDQQLGNWGGIMGATWTSDDKGTSANVSGTYSARSELSDDAWSMYSVVLKHNITDKTHFVLQHDHGFADGINLANGLTDTQWYGVLTHLTYDVKDNLTAGIRGEWFRDQNGFRVCTPARTAANCEAGTYYAITAGLNWKPLAWLNIRPNVRYDWSTGRNAFDAGNQDRQFLFSTDMTINF